MKMRGLSTILAAVLILVTILVVCSILYTVWLSSVIRKTVTSYRSNVIPELVLDGYFIGPGYIVLWLKSNNVPIKIDKYIIVDDNGRVVCIGKIVPPITVKTVNITEVRILSFFSNCSGIPAEEHLTLELVTNFGSIPVLYMQNAQKFFSFITFGYLIDINTAGKSVIQSASSLQDVIDNIAVYESDPLVYFILFENGTILWCYKNLGGKSACGRTRAILVKYGTSILNLNDNIEKNAILSKDTPVLIVINPTYGAKPWTFTLIDTKGQMYRIYLPSVTDRANNVVVDYLIMIEDLWPWSSTSSVWVNYYDTVLRVTIFLNGSIKVSDLEDSGAYYHAIFINSDPKLLKYLPTEARSFYEYAKEYVEGKVSPPYESPLGLRLVKPFNSANILVDTYTLSIVEAPTQYIRVK